VKHNLAPIIKRLKQRDREAQTWLYNQYKTGWYMICLRYNKNRDDASDVLQNALIKIFGKIEQFDENKGHFKSWSSQIVVNENLMFLRKKVASFQVDELSDHFDISNQDETALDMLSAQELTKMIQTLPEGYRAVFNLYVIEGYTHKEIADLLNINLGTSKSQLFKARKMLQKKLEVLF